MLIPPLFTKRLFFSILPTMTANIIRAIYLALFGGEFLLDWFLNILNINRSLKNRNAVPKPFSESISISTYRISVDYTLRKGRFGLFASVESRIILLIVLLSGAAGALDNLISPLNLPEYWHGLLFLTVCAMVLGLINLPTSLYSRFVIEEEFGFNTMNARSYLGDMAKQIPLGLIMLMLMLGGLYGALAWGGLWWPLIAWGFLMVFQILMIVLYPLLIAPIFNKFTALDDGSLKNRLSALAERCRFPNRGIYVMDGSRRSRHSNAYFTGLGRAKRIVIFDTLIDTLEEDELEAVLAHEIGHWKFGHIRRRLAVSAIISIAAFILIAMLLSWKDFFIAFGFFQPSLHALLFWISFFSPPLSSLISPLVNHWSRKHEFQADRFAAQQCFSPDPMKRALLNLSKGNLSNLTPHPAYCFWHYSHPALSERLNSLDSDTPSSQ